MPMAIGTSPYTVGTGVSQNIGKELNMAMDLLKPYRRIR